MNRRNFFGMMAGGIALAAAERSWPFRVYSFPSEPKLSQTFYYGETFQLYGSEGGLPIGWSDYVSAHLCGIYPALAGTEIPPEIHKPKTLFP